ncbi:ABC transporter ATP-binding protein [Tumebacillus permanentifrigoris]|uniref:ABC-2 type transport system ATP-binding protein n=1 Tax=Tumebacillus permanentifrigoris TaxID=378543 RepID=A0A316D5K0_9BACL|nr:ABC transporter ATP-binding protein [Tumebacillus permanentifrigoris]PWK08950.1 ABC-2 type transport system ATP-binding protein [Tumebacillus permanentifrigoris]
MLEVRNITGGYAPDQPVIRDVSLTVNAHEIVGLIGMNGAGKSTILKHVLGLLEPFAGEILLEGGSLSTDPLKFRSKISYIPEQPRLYEELTLDEHLELTKLVYRLEESAYRERKQRLLDVFRLADKVDEFPNTFSKGMQQKVMILCAFVAAPDLLVVDEPFVGLDPLAIQALLELLIEMKREGHAILLSTHILATAERYCDSFVMVNKGQVALNGTVEQMRAQAGLAGVTLEEMFAHVVSGGLT